MASTPQSQLSAHPLPFSGYKLLGAGSTALFGVTTGDHLLAPPPPEGVARLVSGISNPTMGIVKSAGPLAPGDIQLIIKNESGDVVVLSQNSGGEVAGNSFLLGGYPVYVSEKDQGVFLRLSNGATADCYGSLFDTRNITPLYVDVTAIYPNTQPLLSCNKTGQVLLCPFLDLIGWATTVLNYDSNPHTLRCFLTDGINSGETQSPLSNNNQSLPPQTAGGVNPLPMLLDGWSMSVCLGALDTPPTKPVRVILGTQLTNLAPVRQDQGGAF